MSSTNIYVKLKMRFGWRVWIKFLYYKVRNFLLCSEIASYEQIKVSTARNIASIEGQYMFVLFARINTFLLFITLLFVNEHITERYWDLFEIQGHCRPCQK